MGGIFLLFFKKLFGGFQISVYLCIVFNNYINMKMKKTIVLGTLFALSLLTAQTPTTTATGAEQSDKTMAEHKKMDHKNHKKMDHTNSDQEHKKEEQEHKKKEHKAKK